jgi:pyruvate ferredoxin oxidoreductase beta subunit
MEGLDEMKESEAIGGRFVMKEFMTDEVKEFLKEKNAEQKARKKAAKAAVTA